MDKELAIWGSRKSVEDFMKQNTYINPKCIFDNDKNNENMKLMDYVIKNPKEDVDFTKYRIIVVSESYETIANYLCRSGLVENRDFIESKLVSRGFYEVRSDIKRNLDKIREHIELYKNKKIVFTVWIPEIKDNLKEFFRQWNIKKENNELLLGQEWGRFSVQEIEKAQSLKVIPFPFFLDQSIYSKKYKFFLDKEGFTPNNDSVPEEIKREFLLDSYLKICAESMRLRYPNMTKKYAYMLVYWTNIYYTELFLLIRPKGIYLWNEFYGLHMLLEHIARNMDIEISYMEYGLLPGTISVDRVGQMGESWPAINVEEFNSMYISEEDIQHAKAVWHCLYLNKANRKIQPKADIWDILKNKIQFGKPIVLYAGQNDYASGIQPVTKKTKKFHSPIFKSSNEAAIFLARICQKNKWNFIYKPHPMVKKQSETELAKYGMKNIIFVSEADINEIIDLSDVVVTILSTSAYVALVRKRPVVMLGYTQLKDKDCTYQAFAKDEIEHTLRRSIENGFDIRQRQAFLRHIALLNKYYLYDDATGKCVAYGREIVQIKE